MAFAAICTPKGYENLAQGLPWVWGFNATRLTRRYLVAPCWKNTRSAGLEVLKGRQNRTATMARTPTLAFPDTAFTPALHRSNR
jgi:hypothetical protein